MNTSNITNYKPKDFAELLGISLGQRRNFKSKSNSDRQALLYV